MAIPLWLREKLFLKDLLLKELVKLESVPRWNKELLLASTTEPRGERILPSPFAEAIVLTMDGVGEWATTSAAIGRGNCLEVQKEIHFPHSLGFLYSAFTYYNPAQGELGRVQGDGACPVWEAH